VLNPPYSAPGNGLIFVKEAFAMMNRRRTGEYGAVIIQDSAGSGKAIEYCQDILKDSTLIASIKMPGDLFIGKSGVQTSIYVFKVGAPHPKNHLVKFIDFRNDGYKRSNRKKVKDPSINLRPVGDPDGRYAEVAAIVTGRKRDTNYYPLGELYFEDTIDPTTGNDWNFDQHIRIDTKPTLDDFRKTVADYLAWEVDQLLKRGDFPKADSQSMRDDLEALADRHEIDWREYPISGPTGIFDIKTTKKKFNANTVEFDGKHPYVARSDSNNGIRGYISEDEKFLNDANTISFGQDTATMFFQRQPYFTGDKIKVLSLRHHHLTREIAQYLIAAMRKPFSSFTWGSMFNVTILNEVSIHLPVARAIGPETKSGEFPVTPCWDYMENVVRTLEAERVRTLEAYLIATGLSDYTLTERERESH
jgi:hypothetical protein